MPVRRLDREKKSPFFVKAELLQVDRVVTEENKFNILLTSLSHPIPRNLWVSNMLTGVEPNYTIVDPCCSVESGSRPGLALLQGKLDSEAYGWWHECDIGDLTMGLVVIFEVAQEYVKATMINNNTEESCELDSRSDGVYDRRRQLNGVRDGELAWLPEGNFYPISDEEEFSVQVGSEGVTRWRSVDVCRGVPSD